MLKRITSLEPQSRPGSRRVNVFLDGQFAFSLGEELAARLTTDRFLSDPDIADLLEQDRRQQAYAAGLLLLSYRARSVAEMKRRLLRRGFDPVVVEEALERLKTQALLDDEDFARFWVDNRQTHNPRGGRLLEAELRSKGIDREIIEEVLPGPEDEETSAYRVGERKARTLKALPWREFRQKLVDHLVRRGFDYEAAASAARRVWEEREGAESPDPDAE